MSVQIIEKDGHPEWAVLPYEDYCRLLAALEERLDAAALDEAARRLASGEVEALPADMVERLLDEHPCKVWREFRGLTLEALAQAGGVTKSYVSMIEAGRRQPSRAVRERLAGALGIDASELE